MNKIAIRIRQNALTVKQLLQRLRVDASWAALPRCIEDLTLECWAEELGLSADPAALQAELNRFRREFGLLSTVQTTAWLKAHGLSLEELAAMLRPAVLRQALTRHLVTEEDVRRYFLETTHEYDRAEISLIVAADFGAAQELLFRVEEGADFHALARAYSTDAATAKAGGYLGTVGRSDLEPESEAAVFHAVPGAVFGPFERKHGYTLLLVENLMPAELNAEAEDRLRARLFQDRLAAYRRTLEIHEELWQGEGWNE